MFHRYGLALTLLTTGWLIEPSHALDAPGSAPAANRLVSVTVYPHSALVTREVSVPEGVGSFELVVTPLPPQTVNSSLYSEGANGIQVLTTRYRTRPIKEDTREDVRKAEAQLRLLQNQAQKIQSDMRVVDQNLQMLSKLEAFTGATLQQLTEKGQLNGDASINLAKYVMDSRAEKAAALVALQLQQQTNQEQTQFVQRQLQELAAGSTRTERDAIIVVDKRDRAAGTVRLNYLVTSASWRPHYKLRAGTEKDPIQLEYLASVVQQTGEEWRNVNLILSTAEPMLNAAPPDLKMLEVAVVPRGTVPAGGKKEDPSNMGREALAGLSLPEIQKEAGKLRGAARKEYADNKTKSGAEILNRAAALEQAGDLLAMRDEDVKVHRPKGGGEGPSVTYHLGSKLTIPSRNDEQVVEVAKLEMAPAYFYKAVPVLTPHVYRLADLTNRSGCVLLPGEATMYLGSDFVGRAALPLVAVGEKFTAGFGVDPQLQVQRQLTDKSRTMQGDNQVLRFEYRILVSSYKKEPVKLQVWDRLPHAETEAVGVSLVKAKPDVSTDGLYLRESRPHNLLRWDLTVEPAMTGEKALAVQYEFKVELGRQMQISNFAAK